MEVKFPAPRSAAWRSRNQSELARLCHKASYWDPIREGPVKMRLP
jgi:hypothetical protein